MTPLDSRELVLTGLRLYLQPQLTGLVLPQNVHVSWEKAYKAGMVGSGPGEQNALVILDLGIAKPQVPQPSVNERTVTVTPVSGASTTTKIVADQSQVAPLILTAVAAGKNAATTCGLIAATLKAQFGKGGTLNLPLPDDNTSAPRTFAFGLTAQLTRTDERWHTRDPIKQVYALSVVTNATYADYHTETPTVARTVTLEETFTEGLGSTSQTVNRTHA